MTAFSTYLEAQILGVTLLGSSYTAPATVFLCLGTTLASDGDFFTEVTTNLGYGRLAVDFSSPTSLNDTTAVNSASVTFSAATTDWGTVTHFAIFDALTIDTGNMLYWGAMDTDRTIQTDDVLEFQAGNLSIRLD